MSYRERVKTERLARGLTQARLAHLAGLSQNTVSLIERGSGSPSIETLETIADAMGLQLRDLIGDRMMPANVELAVPLPHFQSGSFREWERAIEDGKNQVDYVPGNLAAPGRFIASIVSDTMYPSIWPGDKVLIDGTVIQPKSGSIIAVEIDGDITIRRVRRVDKRLVLAADNAQYPPFPVADLSGIRVIGVLVAVIHRDLTNLSFR
jgi:transcriptional regulator with XRE-family HTH domain